MCSVHDILKRFTHHWFSGFSISGIFYSQCNHQNLTLSSNERAIETDNPLDKKELKLTSLHHYRTDR